ncbi:MAG: alpha/beta hydrolase [Candidatus Schekmanbacteria bacterium]|nr:alpha/beta hydrolase [Candidatus Schekmanbacteria bacterium]
MTQHLRLRPRATLAPSLLSISLLLTVLPAANAATVRVHYDTGLGNAITLRGDVAPLSWTSSAATTWTTGNVWVWNSSTSMPAFAFKPLLNDEQWSVGANYQVPAGDPVVDVFPFFGTATGSLEKVDNFYSPQLNNQRTLILYLPPSYDENAAKRYPVVYMHDGQNLFDPSTSFGGSEWEVDETLDSLVASGLARELIVVGIYNTSGRIDEYTPVPDPDYGGGNGDAYLDFVQKTVKPYVDGHYRTISDAGATGMIGSSLGGLITCYAGWTRSDFAHNLGCMSSSFWWNDEWLTDLVAADTNPNPPVRIYLDSGNPGDGYQETIRMRDTLAERGFVFNDTLFHWAEAGAQHNEAAWAERFHQPIETFYPFSQELDVAATATVVANP